MNLTESRLYEMHIDSPAELVTALESLVRVLEDSENTVFTVKVALLRLIEVAIAWLEFSRTDKKGEER